MKHETAALTGAALDYAVAVAEGWTQWEDGGFMLDPDGQPGYRDPLNVRPSQQWADGGPIIERERLCVCPTGGTWYAYPEGEARDPLKHAWGETALQAAMRSFARLKLGETITLPEGIAL